MLHSFITISSDAGAVECAGPSPKLLGSAALTKHGHSFCQTEDKHTQWVREGTTGERVMDEGTGDKARERDSERVLKMRAGWMDPNPRSISCLSQDGCAFPDKLVLSYRRDSGSVSHWAALDPFTYSSYTLASAAEELHRTAAPWTLRKLLKLAADVLTL